MEDTANSLSQFDKYSSSCSLNENENMSECSEIQFKNFQMKENQDLKTEINEERQWVATVCHQPIDTITKYVDVPVKETKIVRKPKIELVEKVIEVPKYNLKYENKVVEVPEVHFVDKIEAEPFEVERLRYVPKEVIHYNTIKKPVKHNIITEKKVNVLNVTEHITYKPKEIVEEVYNHYDPEQDKFMNIDGNTIYNESERDPNDEEQGFNFDNPRYQYIDDNNTLPPLLTPFGPQIKLPENSVLEKVFVPKVEKIVELKKKIDIPIDCPVPYIVPKPKIIDVKVPVFKFNDKYVPVPIKRKVIPKIKWTEEVYQVDCVIEKPYLVYHDIIKIVPADAKIIVNEYPRGINKIAPENLSEVDNLALWMRVNANLKKEKDAEEKEKNEKRETECSFSCNCSETNVTDRTSTEDDSHGTRETFNENGLNQNLLNEQGMTQTLPLHPGHPLNMVQLQNRWINQQTTQTADLYQQKYLDAHRNAYFNMQTNFPREAELDPQQVLALKEQNKKTVLNKPENVTNAFIN